MNKLNKIFGTGLLTGVALTAITFGGGMAIKNAMTPTEAFVEAKSLVASTYAVSEDAIKLYRHGMESYIWDEVTDTTQFGGENGLYPHDVYTASVDNDEQILAVVLAATNMDTLNKLTICGNPIDTYDVDVSYVTDRYEPVYVARVNVSGMDDIDTIISGINTEC